MGIWSFKNKKEIITKGKGHPKEEIRKEDKSTENSSVISSKNNTNSQKPITSNNIYTDDVGADETGLC